MLLSIRYFAAVLGMMIITLCRSSAQVLERERPPEWDNLIEGGRFMDRFLPMPDLGGLTSDTWGAKDVLPRDINNGIESPKYSYWGGNTRIHVDGKYHLFVCRWLENSPKGHRAYANSIVVHAMSDSPFGPFRVLQEVGPGHNPEWYVTEAGKYVVYITEGYYVAESLDGPWIYHRYEFDHRGRTESQSRNFLHNLSFAKREDGSFIMVNRHGSIWFSKDGISTWHRITEYPVYPPVEGKYEDPVIWKTDVQYHLVVNDWLGRIAWHLRSKDGVHWKVEPGEAYMPGISKHENGQIENWFKYERMKVLQDDHGRATAANFAVIDTLKHFDLPNDHHSSKLITIPLMKGRLLEIESPSELRNDTEIIKVVVKAERDFDPYTDIDLSSLRFGASEQVNFGWGAKLQGTEKSNQDLVLCFQVKDAGLTNGNFAGKLIGKTTDDQLLFGYVRLPWVNYLEPIISARLPQFSKGEHGTAVSIEVENFGQITSDTVVVRIDLICGGKQLEMASGKLAPLKPFEKRHLSLKSKMIIQGDIPCEVRTIMTSGGQEPVIFRRRIDRLFE